MKIVETEYQLNSNKKLYKILESKQFREDLTHGTIFNFIKHKISRRLDDEPDILNEEETNENDINTIQKNAEESIKKNEED